MGPGVSKVNTFASECGGAMEATEPGRLSVGGSTPTGVALVGTIGVAFMRVGSIEISSGLGLAVGDNVGVGGRFPNAIQIGSEGPPSP